MKRLNLYFPLMMLGTGTIALVAINLPNRNTSPLEPITAKPVCAPCDMQVDPTNALIAVVNGRERYFCSPACRDKSTDPAHAATGEPTSDRLIDVVCHMEVNPTWNIHSEFEQHEYHFCTKRCKELFDAAPQQYLGRRCTVCAATLTNTTSLPATYLGDTYFVCNEEHRRQFKSDPASFFLHTMWGIPTWMYYVSIAVVLIASFGVFDLMGRTAEREETGARVPSLATGRVVRSGEARPRRQPDSTALLRFAPQDRAARRDPRGAAALTFADCIPLPLFPTARAETHVSSHAPDRIDLLSCRWINAAARSRVFRFTIQAAVILTFLLIIAAGLFGNQNPALNIAPILTWTIWWGLLIVLIMFAGKAWCYVCPWDAVAAWTEKLAFWRKTDDGISLGWKWPRPVRNVLIATVLFVGLTWIELGFGVTMKPRVTAYLAIAMTLMAVVSALLFDRKSFCRYGCLVGRVSGLYALFASVEVRSKSADVCTSCHTKECVKGSETAYGCPTFLYPGRLSENTYCIQCMECVQACPHDNIAVNFRPWGSDLAGEGKPRADEAYLALLMLAITGFHGLTMTPVWERFVDGIRGVADIGRIAGFSIAMTLLMLGPILIYAALTWISKTVGNNRSLQPLTYHDYFIRYAYALLPIALFYHIAHNLEHLLMEGPKVLAMISDPFGWGWNMFGTARWNLPPLISLSNLWIAQVLLVLIGHVYSLWIARKTSLRLFGTAKAAFRSQLPMLLGMIAFSVFSLWLLKQPMEMRTSAM